MLTTDVVLRRPRVDDEESFVRVLEVERERSDEFVPFLSLHRSFGAWLAHVERVRVGEAPCAAGVPFTLYFGFVGNDIAGSLAIRHALTESLHRIGGHIGFATRPAWRRRGVATSMLGQSIVEARALDLERVLLTCDEPNAGSWRAIERCGGRLEGIVPVEGHPLPVRRYWITTSKR